MASDRGISSQWFFGCTDSKEREHRTATILGSTVTLDILVDIIEHQRYEVARVRESDYSDAAWAYKQAHINGRIEELDRILSLLRSATTRNDH